MLLRERFGLIAHIFRVPPDYPDPWPYKEKGWHYIDMLKDRTKPHFHQNSKLIVSVQNGRYSSIDRYGNDLRKFYHLFPESFRIPDMDMFYKNPMSDLTAKIATTHILALSIQFFECGGSHFEYR
ncbi:hypothetical protein COOONC_05087 [Cooperia oncophora]